MRAVEPGCVSAAGGRAALLGSLLVVALVSPPVAPALLAAQENVVDGIEVWSGLGGWASGPGGDLPAGWRIGLAVGGAWTEGRSVALEALYGHHAPEGRNLTAYEVGVGLLARQVLARSGRTDLFVQARAGWSRRSGDGQRAGLTQDAVALGSAIGADRTLSDRVGLIAALSGTALWHGSERLDGRSIPDSGGFGTRWGLRIGVRIRTAVDAGAGTSGGPG
jgi:hypothetical protein